MTNNLIRVLLVVFCVAGAWISAELLKSHAGPWPTSEGSSGAETAICSGASAGCGEVLESSWAAVDFRMPMLTRSLSIRWTMVVVPVAFIGLSYFVCLGCWFALAGSPGGWGRWTAVPLLTVLGGAVSSLVLIWVMLFELKSPCRWCLATHGINAGLLGGTLLLCWRHGNLRRFWTNPLKGLPAYQPLQAKTGVLVMGIAAGLVLGLWEYRSTKLETRAAVASMIPYKRFVEKLEKDPGFLVREFLAVKPSPVGDCAIPTAAPSPGASPSLVIFTDFECPYCACFAGQWKNRYRSLWQGPIQVRVRHFPLHSECNDRVKTDIHDQACLASYAAEAARLQGGDDAFWRMHDLLFDNSRRLDASPYADLAGAIGLDPDQLIEDMAGDRVAAIVDADIAMAAELGVHGTPAVFLNGRRVPQLCINNPLFWEAISLELGQLETMTANASDNKHDCEENCCRKLASTVQATP